ncbi:MAG: polyphosphate polymerase domain-containing protein [Planctomycetes bacterium]|nr:polyphosphate polymerase domain-containing protein [Planctomycetota bacterium]
MSSLDAYELKFLVDTALARQVEAWGRDHLAIDPHADPALGGAYRVRSIYCDTPELDVYFRNDGYRRRKFRLRRYGVESVVHLERKSKPGDRVRKRRTAVAGHELSRLGKDVDPAWPGFWFQRRLSARRLQPRCLITYERHAHVGMGGDGPMRMTLDHDIRAALAGGFDFEPAARDTLLLPGAVVLELKFQSRLPALFRALMHDMKLTPSGVSKYRMGIEACGLAADSAPVPRVHKAG